MTNDSPPGSFKKTPSGEFTWPPSREELDAIEVIPLDPGPIAPVVAAPAKAAIAAPRPRGRVPLPAGMAGRDDVAFGGILATSLLAIAVAAFMQFSDVLTPAAEPAGEPAAVAAQVAAAPVAAEESQITPLPAQAVPVNQTVPVIEAAPVMASLATATAPATVPAPALAARVPASRRAAVERPRVAPRAVRRQRVVPVDYTRPRLISPEDGRRGKLVLLVEVKKNGKVGDVDVLSSDLDRKNRSHRDLQRAAISTVKRWRYEPAMRDGAATGTQIRVVVNIDLDSSRVGFTEANARRRAMAATRAVDSVLAAR